MASFICLSEVPIFTPQLLNTSFCMFLWDQILKYLSSSYIANKVTVYEQASNEDLCIHLSEDMYLPLAERLYTDIQSMNLFDVFW
jgi:hypothetical protein